MNKLVHSFSRVFPCSNCARDFQEEIKKSPPKLDSRDEFALWFCQQHNVVNKKLGKREMKCSIDLLELRYGRGKRREE